VNLSSIIASMKKSDSVGDGCINAVVTSDVLNSCFMLVVLLFAQRNLMEYYSAVDVSNMIVIFARYFTALYLSIISDVFYF